MFYATVGYQEEDDNMNGKRVWVLALTMCFALACVGVVSATPLLKVDVPDKATWVALQGGGFDILHGPEDQGVHTDDLYIMGWPEDMSRLDHFDYQIFIEDMEAYNRQNLDVLDDMGGYATFDEIQSWLTNFCADHPVIVEGPTTIGYTLQGRELNVFKISDNPGIDEDEPEVFINAAIHAREVVTPLTIMTFATYLVNNYGSDARVTDLVDNREIYMMAVANPDGYYHNQVIAPNGGGMQRKNMSAPDGVDLNRNYDYKWGLNNQGSSGDPYSETYRGPSAGSELSTQAIKAFINNRNFEAVVNYHAYSDLIILPWGWTYQRPANYDTYLAFGNYMNQTLGYEVGGPEIIYVVNGDAQDWQAAGGDDPTSADYPMWAFTFEVGTWQQGGFWPSYNLGVTLANEQIEPMMKFCEVAPNPYSLGAPVPPVMTIPAQVPPAFNATWTHDDPNGNDAVSYDFAELENLITSDGAESNTSLVWDEDGVNRSTAREYAGSYSYYFGSAHNLNNSLTGLFSMEATVGMDLTLRTWYDIEPNWDYAYVMVSTDGTTFETIPGNITTNSNPNGTNIGNGITGSSGGWVQGIFPLDDFAGQQVWVKLAYITDGGVVEEGIYFDEISPIVGFGQMTVLGTDLPNPSYAMNYGVVNVPFTAYFTARADDAEGQTSAWADVGATLVTAEGADMVLNLTGINTFVGSGGGTITYSASLQTFVPDPFPGFNYWTMAILPNGNPYGPISTLNVNIPPNANIFVPMMQVNVPAMAPNGQYTFQGFIGQYPTVMVSDSFGFTKGLGGSNDQEINGTEWSESGWPEEFAVAGNTVELPTEFAVETAYPNPFNPTVSVPFALPTAGDVSIAVYNTLGQMVFEQVSTFNAGSHTVTVDGSSLSSGVYLLSVSHNGASEVQKVVLMK
jgi:Zinc carboxypeptidase/Immune inhibitor A-like, MAM domain/Secretion system C-terminal sorting domain